MSTRFVLIFEVIFELIAELLLLADFEDDAACGEGAANRQAHIATATARSRIERTVKSPKWSAIKVCLRTNHLSTNRAHSGEISKAGMLPPASEVLLYFLI